MLFSFKIPVPQDIGTTLKNLQKKIAQHRGNFSGDKSSGFISASGIEGKYIVHEKDIEVIVLKKLLPLIPNRIIEREIRNIFNSVAA